MRRKPRFSAAFARKQQESRVERDFAAFEPHKQEKHGELWGKFEESRGNRAQFREKLAGRAQMSCEIVAELRKYQENRGTEDEFTAKIAELSRRSRKCANSAREFRESRE